MKRAIIAIAAVLAWGGAREARAVLLPVNWNSKVEYGIEYYIETDKAVYDLGEPLQFLYKVTNVTDENVLIYCSQSSELNVEIRNSEGNTIWLLFLGWLQRSAGVRLAPGESRTLAGYSWDMTRYYDGYPVEPWDYLEPGNYHVVGIIYNQGWNLYHQGNFVSTEIAVDIMIIPEPATFAFLVGGVGLLRLGAKGGRR